MAGRYVRSAILVGSIPLLAEWKTDALALADEIGIDRAALTDPDIPVPGTQIMDFYELAAERSGCRSFGLHMATRTGLAVIGPVWVLLRQARTIGEMLEDLSANFELYTQAAFTRLVRGPETCRFLWSLVSGVATSDVQMSEFALAVICGELRRHAPSDWEPREVHIRHAAPRDRSDLKRVLGPNLRFDQPETCLVFDRALLDRPLRGGGSRTRTLLSHMLKAGQGESDPGLVERIDGLVRVMLPYASCTLADVARALGMAPRTLQEHLQAKGRGFQEIRDSVRADLSQKYLRHSSLSLAHIAEILGYSEPSAFSRSFRRWHGVSARSLRKNQWGRSR